MRAPKPTGRKKMNDVTRIDGREKAGMLSLWHYMKKENSNIVMVIPSGNEARNWSAMPDDINRGITNPHCGALRSTNFA